MKKKEDSDVLLSVQKSEELIFAYELQDDFDTHKDRTFVIRSNCWL